MGGLACAKAIIDNGNAVTQAMRCMDASLQLNASRTQPTYEQLDRFKKAGEALVKVCAEIEVYVSRGGEEEDRTGGGEYERPEDVRRR